MTINLLWPDFQLLIRKTIIFYYLDHHLYKYPYQMTETQENFEVSQGGLGHDYIISCLGRGVSAMITDDYRRGRGFEIADFLITYFIMWMVPFHLL